MGAKFSYVHSNFVRKTRNADKAGHLRGHPVDSKNCAP